MKLLHDSVIGDGLVFQSPHGERRGELFYAVNRNVVGVLCSQHCI